MTDLQRNPFQALIDGPDPDHLAYPERVDVVRRLVGELLAGESLEAQWLGRKLAAWLEHGGDLQSSLGLRPARGSTSTAMRLARARRRDQLLLQLAVAVGSDIQAVRILRGEQEPPQTARPIFDELMPYDPPASLRSISRARNMPRHR